MDTNVDSNADTNADITEHHRCHHCGYDLHGVAAHPRCPECGKPVLRDPETFAKRRLRRGRTSFLLVLAGGYALMGLACIQLVVMTQSMFMISCAFPSLFVVGLPLGVMGIALTMLVEKPRPHPLAYVALTLAVVVVALRAGVIFIEATANV